MQVAGSLFFEQPLEEFLLGVEEEVVQIRVGESLGEGSTKQDVMVASTVHDVSEDRDLIRVRVPRLDLLNEALCLGTVPSACPNDRASREVFGEDDVLWRERVNDDAFHGTRCLNSRRKKGLL